MQEGWGEIVKMRHRQRGKRKFYEPMHGERDSSGGASLSVLRYLATWYRYHKVATYSHDNERTVEAVAGELNTGWKPDRENTAEPHRVSLLPKVFAPSRRWHSRPQRQAKHDWPFRFRSSPWNF
jgi:hypothetical protein